MLIIDDSFPNKLSPFRYREFMYYFENMDECYYLRGNNGIYDFEEEKIKFQYSNKKIKSFDELDNIKICVMTFLNNTYDNLNIIEKYRLPFVFTLYPGGGFIVNDNESDMKLSKIFSSRYFKKVIVTQEYAKEYLINKNLCPAEQIEFIYGVVITDEIINSKIEKKYDSKLNIVFVAHKYSEKGLDKGYDLFIDVAQKILEINNNIKFHVVGNWLEDSSKYQNIEFYGIKESKWLSEFYERMDIILSPNRPFILSEGSFDGFPTASCTEASLKKVVVMCTDPLKQNIYFRNMKDIVIIDPNIDDIIDKILLLEKDRVFCKRIANNGYKKSKVIYSDKEQLYKRMDIIKKYGGNNYE